MTTQSLTFSTTNSINHAVYQDALMIRRQVFMEEQSIPPSLEIDVYESRALHIVGYLSNHPVTTSRLLSNADKTIYKIQRVATLKPYRHQGFGRELMVFIEQYATAHGMTILTLDAQDTALLFYESLGFRIEGTGFWDANLPHHTMIKQL